MPIIKIKQPSGYAQIANSTLRDKRLGLDTRGFLAELLTHTEDLDVSVDWLMEHFGVGRDKLLRITRELKAHGYLETPPLQDDKGQFLGKEWLIYGVSADIRETGLTVIRETRTTGNPDDSLKREDQEEKERTKSSSGLQPDVSVPLKPEKPKDLIWTEFKALLTDSHGMPDDAARKVIGRLVSAPPRGYGSDLVHAIYDENRSLVLQSEEPVGYFTKLLQINRDTTPEERASDKQLREAKRYHIALYANMEHIPDFDPARYVGRFPLLSKFIV